MFIILCYCWCILFCRIDPSFLF